ncbi:MAG: ABC transporter substrate binding protein [Desulfuromonadaceae bacterium]|nr:ABC transporter substrate binding protein [Desulfuromonadaceae bacterium]MDD5107473.1 ABC transporter substrate binding protein [Desulfuromonadaceae bacterium]
MRALLLSIALIIMSVLPALTADVLIVQSGNAPAYAKSITGFKETYKGSTQTILLSDYAEVDLIRIVKEEQPRLVLAVGDLALEKAKKVRQVPVMALMALSYNMSRRSAANIHGISIVASPERYMQLFSTMGIKRVGVVYDNNRTGNYVKEAQQAAGTVGIQLVTNEVDNSRAVMATLQRMNGAVDALWMIPDTTAVTSVTQEAYFNFTIKNNVPVVTFSEKHLAMGAAVTLGADCADMGRQAGELSTKILNGSTGSSGTAYAPISVKAFFNESVLKKLGHKVPALLTLTK